MSKSPGNAQDVVIKISFGGASHRRRVNGNSLDITQLVAVASSMNPTGDRLSHFRYVDGDGDAIILKTAEDLAEARLVMIEKNSTTFDLEAILMTASSTGCDRNKSHQGLLLHAIREGKRLRKAVSARKPEAVLTPESRQGILLHAIREGKRLRKVVAARKPEAVLTPENGLLGAIREGKRLHKVATIETWGQPPLTSTELSLARGNALQTRHFPAGRTALLHELALAQAKGLRAASATMAQKGDLPTMNLLRDIRSGSSLRSSSLRAPRSLALVTRTRLLRDVRGYAGPAKPLAHGRKWDFIGHGFVDKFRNESSPLSHLLAVLGAESSDVFRELMLHPNFASFLYNCGVLLKCENARSCIRTKSLAELATFAGEQERTGGKLDDAVNMCLRRIWADCESQELVRWLRGRVPALDPIFTKLARQMTIDDLKASTRFKTAADKFKVATCVAPLQPLQKYPMLQLNSPCIMDSELAAALQRLPEIVQRSYISGVAQWRRWEEMVTHQSVHPDHCKVAAPQGISHDLPQAMQRSHLQHSVQLPRDVPQVVQRSHMLSWFKCEEDDDDAWFEYEEEKRVILQMGFIGHEAIKAALSAERGNVHRAVERLLW